MEPTEYAEIQSDLLAIRERIFALEQITDEDAALVSVSTQQRLHELEGMVASHKRAILKAAQYSSDRFKELEKRQDKDERRFKKIAIALGIFGMAIASGVLGLKFTEEHQERIQGVVYALIAGGGLGAVAAPFSEEKDED